MSAQIDAMPGSPSADSDRPRSGWRAAIRTANPAARSRRTTRRPRKPVPPNTVAVCAGAQDAFIPYRYRSPTHVAADQFGCVCAIPTLSWNASASPAYLRSLSNFGGYGTVDRCLDAGQKGKCASGSPRIDHRLVHLKRQRFEALGDSLHRLRELGILPEHLHEEGRLLRLKRRPFLTRAVQSLTMFRIGKRMSRVAVGLAGLRQQYEWSRVCRLQAEGEVEEDEWIDVECCKPEDIDENPNGNNDGLGDEKARRAKKASERFSLQGKPVVAKN